MNEDAKSDELLRFSSRYRRRRTIQTGLVVAIPIALATAVIEMAIVHSKADIGEAWWVLTLIIVLSVYLIDWR
jgi:fatty acid desaturase